METSVFWWIMGILFFVSMSIQPILDRWFFPNEDARLKTTEEWKDENMTNKEKVAKWREEQKKEKNELDDY